MKKKTLQILFFVITVILFASCNKDKNDDNNNNTPTPTVNQHSGLGSNHGYPAGTKYQLPPTVVLIGKIRGGYMGKDMPDKYSYNGPFPYGLVDKSWETYGTGTFVNLYFTVFNLLPVEDTLVMPGGLIFCDTEDTATDPVYQRGLILQTQKIPLAPGDTTFIHLPAYCLNLHLMPSSYNSVYYIGPVSSNPYLNQVVDIMANKQLPLGIEYEIQHIIWKITDNGEVLSDEDIAFLNSLP